MTKWSNSFCLPRRMVRDWDGGAFREQLASWGISWRRKSGKVWVLPGREPVQPVCGRLPEVRKDAALGEGEAQGQLVARRGFGLDGECRPSSSYLGDDLLDRACAR